VEAVGIIGAGTMGTGITLAFLNAGVPVTLVETTQEALDAGETRIKDTLSANAKRGRITEAQAADRLAKLTPALELESLGKADLIIEAVFENMALKKEIFSKLDGIAKSGAIIATNTSTLPVVELAVQTGRPERVCGVHFFNPAPAMSLVEIIRALTTSDETIAEVTEFATACGKSPVEVKDRAGFIVNALLFPYLNNAVRMLENGTASADDIDTAMKGGCNFPMGPLALLDLVGLDTSLAILDALYTEFRDPNYAAVPALRRMVAAGQLGRKSGAGFYTY
jgi:3-hydroxybutyryl-CoA dehydrogenase